MLACNSSAQHNLSVEDFESGISGKNIQLLDVRTADEYKTGHLENAMLANWNDNEEFTKRVMALDKKYPVYTYCLSGARSASATEWLRKNGFTAYNMAGGISAWKRAGKPVEKEVMVKQVSLEDYWKMIPADKTVLVDFGAVWCAPCRKMAPVVDALPGKYRNLKLVKIDGSEQVEICKELKIEEFPTFILYKDGKEVWRKQGIVAPEEFARLL